MAVRGVDYVDRFTEKAHISQGGPIVDHLDSGAGAGEDFDGLISGVSEVGAGDGTAVELSLAIDKDTKISAVIDD